MKTLIKYALIGGIIGLLVGTSAIYSFPPVLSIFYKLFLSSLLLWITFNLFDAVLGTTAASSGWVVLPILMGIVGAIYGAIVALIVNKIRHIQK